MSIYIEAIQKLYVAYFSRPADVAGLNYWAGVVAAANGSTAAVSAAFAASAEYKAAYAGKTASQVVDTVYLNLFGRHAEKGGLDYWGPLLDKGSLTIDIVVTAVASGAIGSDLSAYNSKVAAATAFTHALDQPAEILGYAGSEAIARAINFLAAVTDSPSLAQAITAANLDATVLSVTDPKAAAKPAVVLTTGTDILSGTAGNDVFTATSATLTVGDLISGDAGMDTLQHDSRIAAPDSGIKIDGAQVMLSSVEAVSITTSGSLLLDATTWSSVASLQLNIEGNRESAIYATASADISVAGRQMSAVLVNGGQQVVIDNAGVGNASGMGTSMHTAVIEKLGGSSAVVKGMGLSRLAIVDVAHDSTITVVNGTPGHALQIELQNVGFADETARTAATIMVVDPLAGSVTLGAHKGDSALSLSVASATKLFLTNSDWLMVDTNSEVSTRLTTVDGSAATGAIRLKDMAPGIHTIVTGSGQDQLTIATATSRDNLSTPGIDETLNANVSTGDEMDKVYIATTGNGQVNVMTGNDDDEVILESRSGNEKLVVDMGAGTDMVWHYEGYVLAGDTIHGGDGNDMASLRMVKCRQHGRLFGHRELRGDLAQPHARHRQPVRKEQRCLHLQLGQRGRGEDPGHAARHGHQHPRRHARQHLEREPVLGRSAKHFRHDGRERGARCCGGIRYRVGQPVQRLGGQRHLRLAVPGAHRRRVDFQRQCLSPQPQHPGRGGGIGAFRRPQRQQRALLYGPDRHARFADRDR